MKEKTVAIDFDGVLADGIKHGFTTNSRGLGLPVPGAREFVQSLIDAGHRVVVHSGRACPGLPLEVPAPADPWGKMAIENWLADYGFPPLEVYFEKVLADIYIDDYGYQFDGVFPSAEDIGNFKPWWKKENGNV